MLHLETSKGRCTGSGRKQKIKTTYVNNARLASIELTKKVHTKTAHRQAPDIVKQYLKFCTVNY